MKEQIIAQVLPILITCFVGVLIAVIKIVGDAIIEVAKAKKAELDFRLAQSGKLAQVEEAKKVWGIVDEHFRITKIIGETIQLKIDLFNKILLERIPGLTQADIDYLRQAVAGEVNKGKAVLSAPTDIEAPVPQAEAPVPQAEASVDSAPVV